MWKTGLCPSELQRGGGGGWGESVTKLTSNRKVFDFSKDTKCALVCQILKA